MIEIAAGPTTDKTAVDMEEAMTIKCNRVGGEINLSDDDCMRAPSRAGVLFGGIWQPTEMGQEQAVLEAALWTAHVSVKVIGVDANDVHLRWGTKDQVAQELGVLVRPVLHISP